MKERYKRGRIPSSSLSYKESLLQFPVYPPGVNANIFKCVLRVGLSVCLFGCKCACVNVCVSFISRMGTLKACTALLASPQENMGFRKMWDPWRTDICPLPPTTPGRAQGQATRPQAWRGSLQPPPTTPCLISLQHPPWEKLEFSCGNGLFRGPWGIAAHTDCADFQGVPAPSRPL